MTKQITVQDVITAIETLAPLRLAENWDNPGLALGHRDKPVTGIVTALDVTEECVALAKKLHYNMIISHHPLIFKGLKAIDSCSAQGRMIETALKEGIAIYSAHTNLDIAAGGLNDMMANQIGLLHCEGLETTATETLYKVVVYVPKTHAEAVRTALGEAGAGFIGAYSHCSFSATGEGRFKPLDGTNPFIGETDALTVVAEERIETIVPKGLLASVLQAMKEAHPYEEVAYDIYRLENKGRQEALGRIGDLSKPMSLVEFQGHMQKALPKGQVRFAGAKKATIHRVALCTGAGAEFIQTAARQGADAYVTGDVKYHEAQLAKELGLLVVDGGHYGTEICVTEGLKDYLQAYGEAHGWAPLAIHAFVEQEDFFFV